MSPQNPFKGLRPYEQDEKLFGRDRDLILMKDRILSSRTTLLFAGSGVGKTSFLNAKVIPELKKGYCVIWHNRWTGAAEKTEKDAWDDCPKFRLWPPRALGRSLLEVLSGRIWRYRKILKSQAIAKKPASIKQTEDKLAVEVRQVISESLRGSGDATSLARVLSVFKKDPEKRSLDQQRCILILDQFEEVFQYHAFEAYFEKFIASLCEVINDDAYNVRIVFSMREEFLGELSVFDNRIPDLFNNYYRLRNPEIEEAQDIISLTCDLVDAKVHEKNLGLLVRDLSKIEKSFDEAKRATEQVEPASARFLRRNFVPPPYLQIVCDKLWKEQYEGPAPAGGPASGDGAEGTLAPFLANYRAGSDDSVNGSESDSQRAVRIFCEEKLSPPFLSKWEQNLVARVFGFLVTRQGAKMAYELNNLAYHMEERVCFLKHTLQKLSSPDARILRESRGPERSYWFELYHDMYAGAVERWKRVYEKQRRRQARVNLALYSGALGLVVLLITGVLYYNRQQPWKNRQKLVDYKNSLNTPDFQSDAGYSDAVQAYTTLEHTLLYSGTANLLWAEVWQRRAQLYEAQEKRDEALLSLLQAAALVKGYTVEKDYIAQANNLFAADDHAVRTTYCYACRFTSVSPDGNYLLTITKDGRLDILGGPKPVRACDDCSQAQFSGDSSLIAAVSVVTEEPPKNEHPRGRASERSPNNPPSTANPSASPSSDAAPTPGATPVPAPRIVGWRVSILPVVPPREPYLASSFDIKAPQPSGEEQVSDNDFLIKAITKSASGALIAGVLNYKLTVWRDNQTERGKILPIEGGLPQLGAFETSNLLANFSNDGKYLAVGRFTSDPTQFWKVTANGLIPSTTIKNLAPGSNFGFSFDGRYFLAATNKNEVKLWDVASQKEAMTIDLSGKQLSRIGFAAGSVKFFVSERNGSITVWDSDTRQHVLQPFTADRQGTPILLDSEGKTIVRLTWSTANASSFDKWSVETGKQIGKLEISGLTRAANLTKDGLLLTWSPVQSSVRGWEFPPPTSHEPFTEDRNERSYFAGLSNDGETLLTVNRFRPPPVFRVWNVPARTLIMPAFGSDRGRVLLSRDALRVAVIPDTGNGLYVFDRTRPDLQQKLTFTSPAIALAFSPDSKYLGVATKNQEIHLIDTSSYGPPKILKSEAKIGRLTFAPTGKFLLAEQSLFDTPTLEVWPVAGQKALKLDFKGDVEVKDLSTDDRVLIVQDNKVLIRNLTDGAPISEFPYDKDVSLAKFTPDNKFFITCDEKGELQKWDVSKGKTGSPLNIESRAQNIIFSPDGNSFVVATRSWIHRIMFVDSGLRYSDGIVTSAFQPSSVRLLPALADDPKVRTPALRWIFESSEGLEAQTASFDGKMSRSVLQGDGDALLTDWKARLGFQVDSLGYLSRDVAIAPAPPAASPSPPVPQNTP